MSLLDCRPVKFVNLINFVEPVLVRSVIESMKVRNLARLDEPDGWANRPHVRGVAMNPVDHPMGGGEGKSSGGRHPCTPWGVPTKGYQDQNKEGF